MHTRQITLKQLRTQSKLWQKLPLASDLRFLPSLYLPMQYFHLFLKRPDLLPLVQEDREEERLGEVELAGLLNGLDIPQTGVHHLPGDLLVVTLERLDETL